MACVLVYGRVSTASRRRQWPAPARPLTQAELDGLAAWQRRTLLWFLVTMGALTLYSIVCVAGRWLPAWAVLASWASVLATAMAGLAAHFSARCPVCGRRIGFQSALVLPTTCDVCGAIFRPDAPLAALGARARAEGVRVVSRAHLLGLPLLAVAFGPLSATGEARGIARGWLAVGDVAIGVVAVGGIAAGGLSVGGLSFGVLCVGGLAVGIAALGGFAVGGLAVGGLALGLYTLGGLAIGLHAVGGVALAPLASTARRLLLRST